MFRSWLHYIVLSFRDSEDNKKLGNVVKNVSRYIKNENQVSGHKKYAYGYLLYLGFNLLNVVFNFYLLNVFLKGDFVNLGSRYVCVCILRLLDNICFKVAWIRRKGESSSDDFPAADDVQIW